MQIVDTVYSFLPYLSDMGVHWRDGGISTGVSVHFLHFTHIYAAVEQLC